MDSNLPSVFHLPFAFESTPAVDWCGELRSSDTRPSTLRSTPAVGIARDRKRRLEMADARFNMFRSTSDVDFPVAKDSDSEPQRPMLIVLGRPSYLPVYLSPDHLSTHLLTTLLAQVSHLPCGLSYLSPIPLHTLLKRRSTPSKDIQRRSDRQINPSTTRLLHKIKIPHRPRTTSVCHRDGTPVG